MASHWSGFGAGSSSDWFEELFGFKEQSYDDTQRRLKAWPEKWDAAGARWVLEGESGRQFQAGRFWTPTLRELRDVALERGGQGVLGGRLSVRNVRGDVSLLHGSPENRHSTFQVASQFNCLEHMSEHGTPEHGVGIYQRDRTQGPACCVACGPATAFRNYFVEVDGVQGQRRDRQINNLHLVSAMLGNKPEGRFFRVVNGYTLATNKGLRQLNRSLERLKDGDREAVRGALRVGLHEDVQVTSTEWGQCPVEGEDQTVTQVFGSACAVSYSGNDPALWEPFARLVLSASYEATLWAALLNALRHGGEGGSRRVFLTCLGGGVFGNERKWITDAMREAFSTFRDCGLEVCIVTYGGPFDQQLLDLESEFRGSRRSKGGA